MSFSNAYPVMREHPAEYDSSDPLSLIYEVCLQTSVKNNWLTQLLGAHRLLQTLMQGQILGRYQLWDFLIWSEGLMVRVSFQNRSSLSEFISFIKEKSTPA